MARRVVVHQAAPSEHRHFRKGALHVKSFASSLLSSADVEARMMCNLASDARSSQFVAMLPAFRSSGGLATSAEIGDRVARRRPDGLSELSRQIAAGDLISFEWNDSRWLPMFQFDLLTMEMDDGARAVARELASFLDGWEITTWFAAPHAALRGALPVDTLKKNLIATIDAARLDRYVALG
jgi:hypothetical protein